MKKNNLYKISSLFILLSAMLFASCSGLSAVDEVEDTATISISFTETNARMVLPTLDFENFSNFELKGSLNGSAQETIKTWTTYSDFSSGKDNIKIKPGSWTFVFTCEKGSENFSGTTSATITAGSDATNLSFILNHTQTSAKGTAKITFEWPENTVKSVMYYFGEFYSSSSPEPVLVSSDSLQNNKLEITKNNLDAGNYALQVYFFSLNVTKQDLENQLQSESSKNAMGRIIVDEVLENLVVESGLTTEVNHNLKHLKPVTYLQLKDSDGSAIDLNKKYDYKTIQLNSNWHISFFNEAPKVISVKTVTSNSITFTVNDSNHEMVQVVFGDKPYEQGKTYEISYKSNVAAYTMSTCMWVTKAQEYTDSNYDNSNNSYTSNYMKFTCDTTDSGGFLFFLPSAVGEYTIYDMQIADAEGFVYVEGSTVTGGSKFSNNGKSGAFVEGRTVDISSFYMCNHEVTQGEFSDIMNANPSYSRNSGIKRPVEQVNWYMAIAYCNKKSVAEGLTPCYSVSGITDWSEFAYSSIPKSVDETWDAVTCNFSANGYRLPTEAEWEYAALGGKDGVLADDPTDWAGTNNSSEASKYAWYGDPAGHSYDVKTKMSNALGLYDMSGNVLEWCWDRTVSITTETPATGATSGSNRVARGGGFVGQAKDCTITSRGNINTVTQIAWLGFRVVRTAN